MQLLPSHLLFLPLTAGLVRSLLCFLSVSGKYAAINAEAIEYLLPLIHDEKSKVRLYAIKALTMLSEAPEGRRTLLKYVPEFRKRLRDSSPAVQRAAQIAIQVIEWKP